MKSIPDNASLNFTSKSIEFVFDEFVQVKDISNQLVITPRTKETPVVEARGKKISVKFNEDLLPNTTYRLFFGNAIADMHEANTLNDFEFIFSTGNSIDAFKLQGSVFDAYNLKQQADVTIGLFLDKEADSTLLNNKPVYLTRTNNSGQFSLSYLPDSKFKILAFADKNKNMMYDGASESVGFHSTLVSTGIDTLVRLSLFKEENPKLFVKKAFSPYYGVAYLVFNKAQKNKVSAYYNRDKSNIHTFNENNDTCLVYYNAVFDTLKLLVYHADIKQTDTVSISVLSKEKFQKQLLEGKIIFDADINGLNAGKLDCYKPLILSFNNWLDVSVTDSSKIKLIQRLDSGQKEIAIKLEGLAANIFQLKDKLLPATDYLLYVNKGAIKGKTGKENDSIRFSFKTTDPEDYASLAIKLLLPKKENYIVQLLNADDKIISEKYAESSITTSVEQRFLFTNLIPGNYFVKVIEDKNKNGKWDVGSLLAQKQPETIYFNASAIKLLANWDSETEWIVK